MSLLLNFLSAWAVATLAFFFNISDYALCSSTNGIYTVDSAIPRVQCIRVRGSRIISTGNLDHVKRHGGDGSYLAHFVTTAVNRFVRVKVFNLEPGSIVVPGLTDAHAHVFDWGFMKQLQLSEATSVDDIVNSVKAYINTHPDVHNDMTLWVQGMGWDQTKWPSGKFPNAADLAKDPLLENRPIVLIRIDGHASWVSPKVLELMGDLPNEVDGGIIVRGMDGNPTGIFLDNAMDLVPLPPWTDAQMSDYFHTTMEDALQHGLTSIHDAAASPKMISFFKRKAEEGKLPLRLYLMGNIVSDEYANWQGKIPRLINHGTDGRLNVRSVKLFTDGALGSWGAALLQPYSDDHNTSGIMRSTPEKLGKLIGRLWEDGWQVNVHCIGDRANNDILNILEDIIEGNQRANVTTWRPRIEHAQIMTAEDLERVGRLGVIASVQPTHATSDMWYAESRLGPERIKGAYAYQTLLQVSPNKILPLGSDFPVEGINPLHGFHAIVSRLSSTGESPHGAGGWFPEQRLTRAQALKGMTLDPAYASFSEGELGSLESGKKADFVVLDRDIMTVPVEEILGAKVRATVVDGRLVYGKL